MANRLIHSTSPYLLQHAHNPVDWHPWDSAALQKARSEEKPILLSVGYSSCHWCHVMEKNCFENEAIAQLMNQNFICIKLDREERPDIDQIYMDSLHLMGKRGGWPMNVFLTPDLLPFYGGTYFPPDQWTQILNQLALAWKTKPDEIIQIGADLKAGLNVSDLSRFLDRNNQLKDLSDFQQLRHVIQRLDTEFDAEWGGFGQAPKFPMPCVLDFLLFYHHLFEDPSALKMVSTTLEKMAFGGIHDQLGGGFSRYSVDNEWKLPHFEKMLYDNAQLLSAYSHAYAATLDILYRDVALGIVQFIRNEMTTPEGGFYSALDADSEGEEGLYYLWKKSEILEILGEEGEEFCSFYQVSEEGNFENGLNVLWRTQSQEEFTLMYSNRSHADMNKYIVQCRRKLADVQNNRPKPGLDDKILTSWNAMMIKGLLDAYRIFDLPECLKMAYDNASFIKENLMHPNGHLWHTWKNGHASIDGFLDDYAFTIDAFISLYEATFQEPWLDEARRLADYAIEHFYDVGEGLFFYTSDKGEVLIARKKEIMDNVIPASNSAMAMSLHRLGTLFFEEKYSTLVDRMLEATKPLILSEGRYMANWLQVWLMRKYPSVELAFVGKNALKFRKEIDKIFFPNKVLCGTSSSSQLPLLANREVSDSGTHIFVCQNGTCKLPVDNVSAALRLLKRVKEEMIQGENEHSS
jgi:uncharacterized protein YyaL (SSP411 family)